MIQAVQPQNSARGVAWNLGDLYQSVDDPRLTQDLESALGRARTFEAAYRGKIDVEGRTSPRGAARRPDRTGKPQRTNGPSGRLRRAVARCQDRRSAHGALLSRTREQRTVINKHLIFFELEWVKVAEGPAQALMQAPELARYRHYLERRRAWRPHYLSEPEEKIHEEKSITGRAALVRLFDETIASLRFPFRTQKLSLQEILAHLYDSDREVRQASAEGLTTGLKENARLLTFLFNTLVLDHQSDCDLHKFADPLVRATWTTRSAARSSRRCWRRRSGIARPSSATIASRDAFWG